MSLKILKAKHILKDCNSKVSEKNTVTKFITVKEQTKQEQYL